MQSQEVVYFKMAQQLDTTMTTEDQPQAKGTSVTLEQVKQAVVMAMDSDEFTQTESLQQILDFAQSKREEIRTAIMADLDANILESQKEHKKVKDKKKVNLQHESSQIDDFWEQ